MRFARFHAFTLLLAFMAIISGCSDNPAGGDTTGDPAPEGDYLQATFSGHTWTYTDVSAFRTPMFGAISIVAMRDSGTDMEAVTFSMTGINSAGTYRINPENCKAQISTGGTSYATGLDLTLDYGTLTITKLADQRIVGTFVLTLYPGANVKETPLKVTKGRFDMRLPD